LVDSRFDSPRLGKYRPDLRKRLSATHTIAENLYRRCQQGDYLWNTLFYCGFGSYRADVVTTVLMHPSFHSRLVWSVFFCSSSESLVYGCSILRFWVCSLWSVASSFSSAPLAISTRRVAANSGSGLSFCCRLGCA